MDDPLLHEQTPAEYFKALIDAALARQHVVHRKVRVSHFGLRSRASTCARTS